MNETAAGIAYLDGPRLRRVLFAAADYVDAGREELNRINVFPVPDGDTGTNFAMTLRAAAEGVRALQRRANLPTVTRAMAEACVFGARGNSGFRAMAEACVFGARGNSGLLLSQFLLGFRESLGDLEAQLYRSLDEPVEGTILTVSRDVAEAAEWAAGHTHNLQELMQHVLQRAHASLMRTPELLEVLREAGVVDAGAKAFVRILEGTMRLIEGDPILAATEPVQYAVPDAAAMAQVSADQDYGYCTEVLVRGGDFPPSTEVRTALRKLGGSIVVLATEDLWGSVQTTKADDMREQHRELHEAHRRVSVVVDSSCDLPDDLVDAHGMVVVPLQVIAGDETYLDRVEIRGSELYDRMESNGEIFTTSQPSPGAFAQAFEDALSSADQSIGLFVAGALSGTLASAQAAARARTEGNSITLVDSRSASFGLGMLALKAAELVEAGWEIPAIVPELTRVRDQSGGLFTVDTFENLLRSGRVSRGRAWLGGLLDIKPILEVSAEGRIVPLDRVRGRDALVPRVLDHLDRRLTPRPKSLRLAVAHAGAPELADGIRQELVRRYGPRECFVSPVTAALGVHTGPRAWGIFYQVED